MWLYLISGLLTLAYALLVLWYRWAWQRLAVYKPAAPDWKPATRVTVLVPARNESQNIEACLQSLVSQHYPASLMQVLVLDDASEDDTAAKVDDMATRFGFLHCLRLPKGAVSQSHKKRAIEKGIAHASGDLIVCTDADCKHHPQWIATLVHTYEMGGCQFIAAPVVYQTEPTLLSVFQTLDFMTLQGITGASVSQRFHTMCNGANIAYAKKSFQDVGGFEGIDKLPTGDDMLLMYKIYRQNPAGVCWLKSREAVVSTAACASWTVFFQQRIRWASKAAYYDDKRIFGVLVLVYLFNVYLLALAIASLFNPGFWWLFAITLAVKTVVEWFFLWPVAHFFEKRKWLVWFPFFQPVHIIYTVVAGWLGRFGSYRWKGRVVAKPSKTIQAG
jgi:poly-beta-1,6-N-acetyl-D-glucosamine synthase